MANKTNKNKKSKKNNKTLKKGSGFIPYLGIIKSRNPARDPNRDMHKDAMFDIVKLYLYITGTLPTKITEEEIGILNSRPDLIKLFTNKKTSKIRFIDPNMLNNLNRIFEEKKIEKRNNFNIYLCDNLNILKDEKIKCKRGEIVQNNFLNTSQSQLNNIDYNHIKKIVVYVSDYLKYLNDYNKEKPYVPVSLREIFSDGYLNKLYNLNYKYNKAILPITKETTNYYYIDQNDSLIKIKPEVLTEIRKLIDREGSAICKNMYYYEPNHNTECNM